MAIEPAQEIIEVRYWISLEINGSCVMNLEIKIRYCISYRMRGSCIMSLESIKVRYWISYRMKLKAAV